ncbi:MFS general substrate transporter [Lindgomyces ingoldianus]|uniref:MFS general substrate transporter n=1 Tax=Lindgomyces ingoldianus TaxID=673940 RepID=A0ACB6R4U6_9PLEO|nr:MFS general substrate transporter [Lindgomyces ingoldianus]KAF2474092.1 MFS general substrate transporter [Lindgomyces ingoldianus]
MEGKPEQVRIENTIEPVETPSSPYLSQKDVPLVLKQAHENNFHIHLGWRSWLIIFLTCFCLMAQVFVVTAAGQVLAFIVRDLGEPNSDRNTEISGWIIQGPLLMQSIFSPTVGRLSDVLDRKYMSSIPPLFAFAGAVISAKAQNMSMLIGGSILIGITLSTAPIIHAIQAEVLPLKYRAVANAFSFIGASVGSIAGGLGAGALTSRSADGWRGVFWIQAALHAVTALGFLLFYWPTPHPDYPKMSLKELAWECDPFGSFFFISSSALLLLAFDWAGGTYHWKDPHVAAPLGLGCALMVCFILYEWKGRKDGLVSHVFFQSGPNFPVGVLGFTVEGWIFYSAVNSVVPQQILHLGFEPTAWRISIRQLAYAFPSLATSLAISAWATKKRDLTRPLFITFGLFLVGVVCYATLKPGQSKAQIVYTVIVGMGQAGPLTLLVPLVQFTAPHAFLSTASGLAYSGRAMGGAFGSAVLNAIINNHLNKNLARSVGSAATKAGLPQSSVSKLMKAMAAGKAQQIQAVPGINNAILQAATHASQEVYARAYNLGWWSIFPFVVICMIGLCFLRGVKELMTEKVEATVEKIKQQEKGEERA